MTIQKRTREQIVEKVAQDIPTGSYVNLGIGLPTRVAGYLKPEQDIVLHSENGVLGFTALTDPEQADDDLINAGKELVSMLDGGSFMNSADSFDIMRGGHLDFCIMGAFQVAVNGDLANWHTGALDAVPAVGGAMDLAVGARCVYVCMEHVTKNGEPRIVEELTYNCGCAVKYIWRSPYKGKRIEDLRKAIESLELEIARLNRKADLEVELQFPTTPPATLTPPA